MTTNDQSLGKPDDKLPSVFRFATELVAWVATPWALERHSVLLAVLALVLLIGVPTVFSTPGDKQQVIVPVPGYVTIAIVVVHMAAAVAAAWVLWPVWAVAVVGALVLATAWTELPRWRWLLRLNGSTRTLSGPRPSA
ncbi:hypothetical protein [Yinghuangia seranimata]|uniref:hypothetical protein n=1 Tax=Yinghuangia seranimata TaxID=408067 RepID=UPI00248AB172|nr:hypothetical protein [Yinghuangia seranimata]MDI2130630.1 hypothetical protein [Yinghuangia seranimata]